jgi:hypothetical protein
MAPWWRQPRAVVAAGDARSTASECGRQGVVGACAGEVAAHGQILDGWHGGGRGSRRVCEVSDPPLPFAASPPTPHEQPPSRLARPLERGGSRPVGWCRLVRVWWLPPPGHVGEGGRRREGGPGRERWVEGVINVQREGFSHH